MKQEIYFDNAATTPVDKRVLNEMLPYFSDIYGNPGSFHNKGKKAKEAVEDARSRIAKILNCKSKEIIFTSGGTESINFALKGIAFTNKSRGNHIITSEIEHHAVLHTCDFLEKNGFQLTYLKVDKFGLVNPKDVESAITDKTILVSIMYANNEIGTIEPIAEIGKICRQKKVYLHTDACQAAEALDLSVSNLNVDLMTLNGSKIYGPKGVGILYLKEGIKIEPLIHGGGQEFDLRSGTENVPFIIGFAKALEISQEERKKESERLIKLRDALIDGLLKIPKTKLNGHPSLRLPNNINVSFLDIEGEAMLLYLNEKGVYASTGSACASKSLETSHVLRAIGLPYEASHGSLRFSLGKYTTLAEIKYLLKIMPKIVETLRKISPLNLSMEHYK
ncbi:MAG: cysteine desulfurase NifS [Nanoarchaeota archaeon]